MPARIALLRGVNVSGANKLPMAAFRAMLADLGLDRVQTYAQSGNAVFDNDLAGPALEAMIRDAVAARFGFAPETFVLTAGDITDALTDHPFASAAPNRVHVFFLRETPAPDDEALRAVALPGDGWHIAPRRFTLCTPAGFGRSKLADRLPRLLPAPMTARNVRTIAALHAMLAERA
jgi:uncharacterized protein (DUF1697 family)